MDQEQIHAVFLDGFYINQFYPIAALFTSNWSLYYAI